VSARTTVGGKTNAWKREELTVIYRLIVCRSTRECGGVRPMVSERATDKCGLTVKRKTTTREEERRRREEGEGGRECDF
jgi:hypothetical protein